MPILRFQVRFPFLSAYLFADRLRKWSVLSSHGCPHKEIPPLSVRESYVRWPKAYRLQVFSDRSYTFRILEPHPYEIRLTVYTASRSGLPQQRAVPFRSRYWHTWPIQGSSPDKALLSARQAEFFRIRQQEDTWREILLPLPDNALYSKWQDVPHKKWSDDFRSFDWPAHILSAPDYHFPYLRRWK